MALEIKRNKALVAMLIALTASGVAPAAALGSGGISSDPEAPVEPPVTGSRALILQTVKTELQRDVRERNSNNVPRYRFGRGAITPYSIRDQWCVAFGTWSWSKAGFTDYLGTTLLRRSYGGQKVAIQVRDLSRWAKKTKHWTYRATPGDLVAYGEGHVGVVVEVDRSGRAVRSIEGNKNDGVRWVRIDMSKVTGYITPSQLTSSQIVPRTSERADID